jgi:hypothetical protein
MLRVGSFGTQSSQLQVCSSRPQRGAASAAAGVAQGTRIMCCDHCARVMQAATRQSTTWPSGSPTQPGPDTTPEGGVQAEP